MSWPTEAQVEAAARAIYLAGKPAEPDPDTYWRNFIIPARAALAAASSCAEATEDKLAVAALSEGERHAIAHARYQVERASPENPDVCFDFDLVKALLRVIDRGHPPSGSQGLCRRDRGCGKNYSRKADIYRITECTKRASRNH